MITRFVKLPNHKDVIIGRDLSGIFKDGYIYEVREFLGEYVISEIGRSSLSDDPRDQPNANSKIESMLMSGRVYFTKEELNEVQS
jgi:hypothetical protein